MCTPGNFFPPAMSGIATSSPYPQLWLASGEESPRLTCLTKQSLSHCLGGGIYPNPAQLPGWGESSYYSKLHIHYLSNGASAAGL